MTDLENRMVLPVVEPKAEIDTCSYEQKLSDWVEDFYISDSELFLMFQESWSQEEFYSFVKRGTVMDEFKQWFRTDIAYNWDDASSAVYELGESKVAELIHQYVEERI
jgi:hypothetical protein